MTRTAILYYVPGADHHADHTVTGAVTVLACDPGALVDAARHAVELGAARVELCGATGPVPQACVQAALGDVPVGAVLYGFESFLGIADYTRSAEAGDIGRAAFLYRDPDAPARGRVVERREATVVGVPDNPAALAEIARLLAGRVALVELYGGLGAGAARTVLAATGGAIPVGLARYDQPLL